MELKTEKAGIEMFIDREEPTVDRYVLESSTAGCEGGSELRFLLCTRARDEL